MLYYFIVMHNPLEPDAIDISDPPRRTARQLFSITDNDDDGFIYDEIFDVYIICCTIL